MQNILCQDFAIKDWRDIRQRILEYTTDIHDIVYRVKNFNVTQEMPDVAKHIEDAVSQRLLGDYRINECLVFENRPWTDPNIHVDGISPDRVSSAQVALNMPLLNPKGAFMIWYDGKYNLQRGYNAKSDNIHAHYLDIAWLEPPREIYRHEILNPMLVKVGVPHRVINPKATPRIMLTMRFLPDLQFLAGAPSYPKSNAETGATTAG